MSVRTPNVRANFLLACVAYLVGTLAASSTVLAHPGHSVDVVPASSPTHYVLQPEHGAGLLAFALLAFLVVRMVRRIHSAHALQALRVRGNS